MNNNKKNKKINIFEISDYYISEMANKNGDTREYIEWGPQLINKLSKFIYDNLENPKLLESMDREKLSMLDSNGRNIIFSLFTNLQNPEILKQKMATINFLLDNDLVESLTERDDNGLNLIFSINNSVVGFLPEETLLKITKHFDVNEKNAKQGTTPIAFLHSLQNENVFKFFLKHGADVNLVSDKGNTIAHAHAIRFWSLGLGFDDNKNDYFIKLLNNTAKLFENNFFIFYKDMLEVKNQDGHTPMDLIDKALAVLKPMPEVHHAVSVLTSIKEKVSLQKNLEVNAIGVNMLDDKELEKKSNKI